MCFKGLLENRLILCILTRVEDWFALRDITGAMAFVAAVQLIVTILRGLQIVRYLSLMLMKPMFVMYYLNYHNMYLIDYLIHRLHYSKSEFKFIFKLVVLICIKSYNYNKLLKL